MAVVSIDPIIERATTKDVAALCALLTTLFDQEAEFTSDPVLHRRAVEIILSQPETGQIWVAKRQGEIVGMINLLFTISTALGAPVALLEDVVVAPAHRNTGIGSRLVRTAIEAARQRGCRRITLLTDANNTGAQRLYARHGFERSAMTAMRLLLT